MIGGVKESWVVGSTHWSYVVNNHGTSVFIGMTIVRVSAIWMVTQIAFAIDSPRAIVTTTGRAASSVVIFSSLLLQVGRAAPGTGRDECGTSGFRTWFA